jgi:hypothetical protein
MIQKVNYGKATNSSADWLTKLLWSMITPGYTAIFMLLTGAWYLYKAMNTTNPDVKAAFYETAIAFGLWGLFNGICYVYLAFHIKRTASSISIV